MAYRRLPLSGLCNARDLGGYPVPGGGTTAFRAFVRSEVPSDITESDISFLMDYGISMSVDFRGIRELERTPSMMKGLPGVEYRHIPVFNEVVAKGAGIEDSDRESFPEKHGDDLWQKMYVSMAEEHKDWVKKSLETAASASGCVMYNCTTGKDRTGMFTAFLLAIAGVSSSDIIADYCVSQVYLRPMYLKMFHLLPGHTVNGSPDLSDPFFKTAPENMEALLNHFDKNYGGVLQYLKECGVSDDAAEIIRRKLAG